MTGIRGLEMYEQTRKRFNGDGVESFPEEDDDYEEEDTDEDMEE